MIPQFILQQEKYPALEGELYSWFTQELSKHIPIFFELLSAKARQLYQNIYREDNFAAIRDWPINLKKGMVSILRRELIKW